MSNETTIEPTARQRTLAEYGDYIVNGRITMPGKFEGEPIFAEYFWSLGLEGFTNDDNGTVYTFKFAKGDKALAEWPELVTWLGRKRTLRMSESEQGFVRCF